MDNPVFGLSRINELELKIATNSESATDYEEIDEIISAITGRKHFLRGFLTKNGMIDFNHFIKEKRMGVNPIAVGRVSGAVTGALSFLKDYAVKQDIS